MQKFSDLFIKNIDNLPIWVKQVLAVEVSRNLINKLGEFSELMETDTLFQYLEPKITFKGKQELKERNYDLSEGHYLFLDSALKEENIFEITLKNSWALSDSAKIICRLAELELIDISPKQEKVYALAQFISNKIKTGDFLKKIGKIDAIKLEQALRCQKDLNNEGRHVKMASVLIKLGFITDKGLDTLLLLKEESKRRLTVSMGLTSIKCDNIEDKNAYVLNLQKEIARLESENIIMKKRLRKFLNIDE